MRIWQTSKKIEVVQTINTNHDIIFIVTVTESCRSESTSLPSHFYNPRNLGLLKLEFLPSSAITSTGYAASYLPAANSVAPSSLVS